MSGKRFKIGIIGLQPGRSWAARAHVPALRSLSDDFEIVGVANSSRESAEAAAAATGIPRAFADVSELVASPDVEIVAVTVKVPHHFDLVQAAVDAGKHVYCEWPLGNGLAEAEQMAAMAKAKGVLGVVGTQARVSPAVAYVRDLIADGYVGEVLSVSLVGRSRGWGGTFDRSASGGTYVLDKANGATMLTIPIGHTLAAVRETLGPFATLSAQISNRRSSVLASDTGEMLPMTAPDQVILIGTLESGAPLSLTYLGGTPRGDVGLLWEINGSDGELRVTGLNGHTQVVELSVEGGRGEDKGMRRLEVPPSYLEGCPAEVVAGNVARLYARMAADIRAGTRTAPTFDDAVEVHRVLAAAEESSGVGRRMTCAATEGLKPQNSASRR